MNPDDAEHSRLYVVEGGAGAGRFKSSRRRMRIVIPCFGVKQENPSSKS